jgi:hypothetical protein
VDCLASGSIIYFCEVIGEFGDGVTGCLLCISE